MIDLDEQRQNAAMAPQPGLVLRTAPNRLALQRHTQTRLHRVLPSAHPAAPHRLPVGQRVRGVVEPGVHIKAVADLLGHSSIAITGDIYGHAWDATTRAAVDGPAVALGCPQRSGDRP